MISGIGLYIEAVIAMLVIAAPLDPVKILFFSQAITTSKRSRLAAAFTVSSYVAIVLVGAALVGQQVLQLLGINLNAFSAVGGSIIALMGFEMLYGGNPSKAQGQDERATGPDEADGLLVPLTIPLIAGPGAITTTITIAAQDDGLLPALFGAGAVAVLAYASYAWLGSVMEAAKPTTVAILTRIGGLILATIGAQMMLGGLKNFFS